MANITKVPNGPLIKKKGPFKGSTLKSGGTVKKAQGGAAMTKRDSTMADIKEQTRLRQNLTDFRKKVGSKPLTPELIREKDSLKGLLSDYSTKKRVKGTGLSADQLAKNDQKLKEKMAKKADAVDEGSQKCGPNFKSTSCPISKAASKESKSDWKKKRNGGPVVKKAQKGGTYYASSKGRVGRLSSSNVVDNIYSTQNESMDTTGYAKGKKEFIKTKRTTLEKPSLVRVKREDVPKVISEFKKGSTQKMDLRTPNQKKKSKMKTGGMIKRADGSMSRRGLWDNIRANKGSGKKPTAAMLKQEKKIKAKTKK